MSNQRLDRGFRFPLDKYHDDVALNTNFKYLQEYLNYIRKKDLHRSQIIIAAANTEYPHSANLRCDGSNDDEAIQEYINGLAASELEIVFLDGDYSFSAVGVDFGSKNVAVYGTGWPLFTLAGEGFTSSGHAYYNGLKFTGGATTTTAIDNGSNNGPFIVENCFFDNMTVQACIGVDDGSSLDSENFFFISGCVFADITLSGGGGASPRGVIWGDSGNSQTFQGVIMGNRFEDCSGGNVFESNGGKRVMIFGNVFQSCTLDTGEATFFNNFVNGTFTSGATSLVLGDLSDVGDGTPTLNNIILGDGDSWESTPAAEVVADIVGTMVTGNTETGITVTYQDSDNTLDFVLGALGDLSDVGVGTPTAGHLLEGDGDSWESVAPSTMDLADFGSGAAAADTVPTADGAGGVAWDTPAGGAGASFNEFLLIGA